jgi:beta-lactamase superfamily II metal-dependent hydrolase
MPKLLLLFFLTFSIVGNVLAQKASDTTNIKWEEGYLDIHHINTGRGVATFMVMPDGTKMVIDLGDMDDSNRVNSMPLTITEAYPNGSKNSGEWVIDYMNQVVPKMTNSVLDYVLLTHFHSDHFGLIRSGLKKSEQGKYYLSGLTQLGEQFKIKNWIDRNYPDYNYPYNLKVVNGKQNKSLVNLLNFVQFQKEANGMKAASLLVGTNDQIVLNYQPLKFPDFKIVGVKRNATIWTGKGKDTFDHFTIDSILQTDSRYSENPLSLALKISYGKFDYFTGGDNTGLQGYGLPNWVDVETPMAKAVGKVEVTTLNHHGNRDATNEFFLKTLQPKAVVEQTWCSDHPGQEVMHRLLSDHLYAGEKNVFATNIQEVTKQTLGFWFTRGYKSMFGHVIVRVLPGGDKFYVLIAETIDEKIIIKKKFGPFTSE